MVQRDASYWNPKGSTWTDNITLPTRSASRWSTRNNAGNENTTEPTSVSAEPLRVARPAKEWKPVEFGDFTLYLRSDELLKCIMDDQRSQKDTLTIIPEEVFKRNDTEEYRKATIKQVFDNLVKQLHQALQENVDQRLETMQFMSTLPGPQPTLDLFYDSQWNQQRKDLPAVLGRQWEKLDVLRADMMKNQLREFVRKVMNDTEAVKHKGLARKHEVEQDRACAAIMTG